MPDFVYPLLSLVIDFVCLLMCLKFIFSKKGAVWIVPVLLTLIFLAGSALCLLAQTSTNVDTTTKVFSKALSIFFLGASFIWLIDIVVFRAALNPSSVQAVKDKRNLAEALFIRDKTAPKTFWQSGDDDSTYMVAKRTTRASQEDPKANQERKAIPSHKTDVFEPMHTRRIHRPNDNED